MIEGGKEWAEAAIIELDQLGDQSTWTLTLRDIEDVVPFN